MQKPKINLCVVGHVDSGKSTTVGHLYYLCGKYDRRQFEQLSEEAETNGKGTFKFAYIFDRLKSERMRGITIDICLKQFETEKFDINIIDSPGHRDFIKNMISGATQSDAALLVLDSRKGKFETGMSDDGQTREHALLCYMFGIRQLIVGVNKMDEESVNYSQRRFEEIRTEMIRQLGKIGFRKKHIQFVPISGWTGENIMTTSENMRWWSHQEGKKKNKKKKKGTGKTLLMCLDSLRPPKRQVDKPFRMPVSDVMKIRGVGTVVTGKVAYGRIQKGMKLTFGPCLDKKNDHQHRVLECRSIQAHRKEVQFAEPGFNVGVNIRVPVKMIQKGDVLGDVSSPPRTVKKFLAFVMIMDHPGEIMEGFSPVMICHTSRVSCRFQKMLRKVDKKTQKVIEENPKFIKKGESCEVVMVPHKPICVEKFNDFPHLGRFAIRDMNRTIGIGIVKEILEEEKNR